MVQTCGGNGVKIPFPFKPSVVSRVSCPSSLGIAPVKPFRLMESILKLVQRPISLGRVPVKSLSDNTNVSRFVRLPISGANVPFSLLPSRNNETNSCIRNISGGNDPVIPESSDEASSIWREFRRSKLNLDEAGIAGCNGPDSNDVPETQSSRKLVSCESSWGSVPFKLALSLSHNTSNDVHNPSSVGIVPSRLFLVTTKVSSFA
eukprot:CAMPEP_0116564060 /NCGR_PEP_ID=MMETSP0397-20121206/13095_1 /TAXON_ID=216820 /ORGANISM="Cyclophora tenuis, Strain ECT3854" /LENGTH=204 /DNA_ID=CAMNT_0004090605 /DNA_START=91 /DNA_END=702 /DNA_ORIENTATION=+